MMREKGYLLFVVSNQSGVGRGIISDQDFMAVHGRTLDLLREEEIEIDLFLYCFHRPEDQCSCRKPKPGLIPKLHGDRELDWSRSYTVGDKASDLDLADSIGAQAFLVLTGEGAATWQSLKDEGKARVPACATLLDVAKRLPGALSWRA